MTAFIQQSTALVPLPFMLISSSDHISGATGKAGTVSVKLSKNGGTGVTPSGAISEVDPTNNPGLYVVGANTTDSNTIGPLWLTATCAGCDPCDTFVAQVIGWNFSAGAFAITSNVKRNQSLTGFMYPLTDSTLHLPKTGAVGLTSLIAQDGNAPVATANAPTEVGSGLYTINLQAAELNFVNVILILSATGCDVTYQGFITQP